MGIDLVARAKMLEGDDFIYMAYIVTLRDVETWLRELGSIERADELKRILEEIE